MSTSKSGRPARLPVGVERIERAGGRVVYRATAYDSVTQQRFRQSFPTATEAVAWRVKKLREIDESYRIHGIEPARRSAPKRPVTMAELGDAYMRQLEGAVATQRSYGGIVRYIVDYFGESTPVASVERVQVREWVRYMTDAELARGTRAGRISVLRGMFALAIEQDIVIKDPTAGVTVGQGQRDGERRVGRYPTPQEIVYAAYFMPPWLEAAVYVAADSGLRRSELAGLLWSSVDLERRAIWVGHMVDLDGTHRGYTKRRGGGGWDDAGQAWVPMSERTADALTRLYAARPGKQGDRVFRRPNRDRVAPKTIWIKWSEARKAGMDPELGNVRLHDLRWHTATEAVEGGMPINAVMKIMRHSSPRMTHRYVARPSLDEVQALYREAFNN